MVVVTRVHIERLYLATDTILWIYNEHKSVYG